VAQFYKPTRSVSRQLREESNALRATAREVVTDSKAAIARSHALRRKIIERQKTKKPCVTPH
jgi:hypothetical protein